MEWNFCRYFWSRSAGFPMELLDTLRSDDSCRAIDTVRSLERSQIEARSECAEILRSLTLDGADLIEARRMRRALAATVDEMPPASVWPPLQQVRWTALQHRLVELRHDLRAAVVERSSAEARDLRTSRERLAAAMLDARTQRGAWQSSRSMARGFRALTHPVTTANARRRALERHAVLFLQRIAAKYPLLGDLGLCAWGELDPEASPAIRCEPGSELVAARERLFEHWPIQAVATAMHADPQVRDHCPVRLSHGCALEARTLFYPIGHRANLEPAQVKILGWCDGTLTLSEARTRIAADAERTMLEPVLHDYLERGVLTTQIPIPTGVRPERHLLAFVRNLPETCATKSVWSARVEAVIELRDAMARSTSREDELELEQRLDESFTHLTGKLPTRGHGAMHGGRFLTYEDAQRDTVLRLGSSVRRDLDQLQPVLALSRWIVLSCVEAYEQRYGVVFDRLAAGLDHVDCVRLMRETQWISETTDIETEVHRSVQDAWSQRLGDRAGHAPLVLDEQDFRAVLDALPNHVEADGPWTPGADVHSLSVLPSLSSNRDGYQLVLGKLYKAVPFLVHPAAQIFCPAPAAVLEEITRWLRSPLLQFVNSPSTYHRSNLDLPCMPGLHEALLPHAYSSFPAEQTVRVGELVVTRDGGRLWVQTRDGRIKCGMQALRWSLLQKKLLGVDPFPHADKTHLARVTMGNWVLSREQWRVPSEPLVTRARRDGALVAARAWQAELGLPDRIFVRSTAEPKAVYIDLRSHLFADVLVALARQIDELTVVEMLPTPEQCVLRTEDKRYVSEMRLTAFAGPPTL